MPLPREFVESSTNLHSYTTSVRESTLCSLPLMSFPSAYCMAISVSVLPVPTTISVDQSFTLGMVPFLLIHLLSFEFMHCSANVSVPVHTATALPRCGILPASRLYFRRHGSSLGDAYLCFHAIVGSLCCPSAIICRLNHDHYRDLHHMVHAVHYSLSSCCRCCRDFVIVLSA